MALLLEVRWRGGQGYGAPPILSSTTTNGEPSIRQARANSRRPSGMYQSPGAVATPDGGTYVPVNFRIRGNPDVSSARARHLSIVVALSVLTALLSVLGSRWSVARRRDLRAGSVGRRDAPVIDSGDAVDDPAIWVHPTDPTQSLVIGNDKRWPRDLRPRAAPWCSGSATVLGQRRRPAGRRHQRLTHDVVGVVQRACASTPSTPPPGSSRLSPRAAALSPSTARACASTRARRACRCTGSSITIAGGAHRVPVPDDDGDGLLPRTTSASSRSAPRPGLRGRRRERCALRRRGERRPLAVRRRTRRGGHAGPGRVLTAAGGHLTADIEGVTLVDRPRARAPHRLGPGGQRPARRRTSRLPPRGHQRLPVLVPDR